MKPSEVIEKYGWIQHKSGSCEIGFCLTGAVHYAYKGAARYSIFAKLHEVEPRVMWLATWNDDPARTKEEVIARLKLIGQ